MGHCEPAITLDEFDLEWCFQPSLKLVLRHLSNGYVEGKGRPVGACAHQSYLVSLGDCGRPNLQCAALTHLALRQSEILAREAPQSDRMFQP